MSLVLRLSVSTVKTKVGKIASYHYATVHAYITCEDCGKVFQSHKNAQAISKIYAEKYRHKVSGELGISLGYDHRD